MRLLSRIVTRHAGIAAALMVAAWSTSAIDKPPAGPGPTGAFPGPEPGDVFREYTNSLSMLRVGGSLDYGGKTYSKYLALNGDFDLADATRAEVIIEKVLCHGHTYGLCVKFNDDSNPWIKLPESSSLPSNQWTYQHHYATCTVAVPLSHLQSGTNKYKVAVDDASTGWEQNLLYGIHVRIYYSASKPHSTGSITSPAAGGTLGLNPTISAQTSGSVARVEFVGYYEDYDYDGDGNCREWQYRWIQAKFLHNLGTDATAPYAVTWQNEWVPDQTQPMKIAARIVGSDGVIYMTPAVENVSLARPNLVEMCKPYGVPAGWVTRSGAKSEKFDVKGDLSKATAARYVVSTWRHEGAPELFVNSKSLGTRAFSSFAALDTGNVPVANLKSGQNTFGTGGTAGGHHGTEINWPGFVIFIQYQGTPTAPVIVQEPQDVSATENETVSFSVVASGWPEPTCQWKKNGADISGATSATYSFQCTLADDGAKFSVLVKNSEGQVTSREATLTVVGDTTGPKLMSVTATSTAEVHAVFDEALGASANTASNYAITGGAGPSVTSAELQAGSKTVKLTVSPELQEGVDYTLTVTGVKDEAGNDIQAAHSQKTFRYAAGLVGWWTFDDRSGTTAADSSPSGNDGTVNGTATWTTGTIGGALEFDGSTYVAIPNEADYDLANAVSYSVWIKVGSSPVDWFGVITKYDNMNLQRRQSENYLTWQTAGLTDYQLDASTNVLDGQWHHVACTYDGSMKRIYVDGSLDGEAAATGSIDTTDTQVEIGRNGRWQDLEFVGVMDDVRIYNRAITLEEVQALYAMGSGGPQGPTITQHPQGVAVTEGDPATFTVAASGTGTLHYQWYEDGSKVGTDSDTYAISSTTLSQNGHKIYCVVTDDEGSTQTGAATLTVTGSPANDTDGDGLSDSEEAFHGTDPDDPDTDDDGMTDGWEVANGLNPNADDAAVDTDGDGYTNYEEFQAGTDPRNPDSTPASGVGGRAGGISCAGQCEGPAFVEVALLIALAAIAYLNSSRRRPAGSEQPFQDTCRHGTTHSG